MQRDNYLDWLKGIAILSVIVGHSIAGIAEYDLLFNLIYSFHMPLLMFVSAYIEEGRTQNISLIKKAEALLIPYLSWTILYQIFSDGLYNFNLTELINKLVGNEQSGLWFLPVLFGLKCLHYMYRKISDKIKNRSLLYEIALFVLLEIVVLLFVILIRNAYLINMLSYSIPYFFGVLLANNNQFKNTVSSQWIIALVSFVYLVVFQKFSFYSTTWTTQVVRILLSICVIIILCNYRMLWKEENLFSKLICWFGRNTIAIYLLHVYFVDYQVVLQTMPSVFIGEVAAVVLSIGVASVCICIYKIVGNSEFIRRVLFGK